MVPITDSPPNGHRPRFSKLAGAAILFAPLLIIGSVGGILFWTSSAPRPGMEGLGKLIALAVLAHVVVIGGTITACLSIVLGCVAQRQIRNRPDALRGRGTARAAVMISAFSLLGVWGVIGTFEARRARHTAAVADIQSAFAAVAQYARNNDTFPDTLEQVTSAKTAARYVYLGRGLPSDYADTQTQTIERVVLMYATHDVEGKFAAIFSTGTTHEWTKPVLEGVLRKDAAQRARGLSIAVTHEPKVDGRTLGYRIEQLMSDDKASRKTALNELWRFGPKAGPAIPALTAALKDDDETIRHGAAYAMTWIGPAAEDAVPALILAAQDRNHRVRSCVLNALGKIGPKAKASVPAIVEAMKDPDAGIRTVAAEAAGNIGPAAVEAVPQLTKGLDDPDKMVRRFAAQAIGQIQRKPQETPKK